MEPVSKSVSFFGFLTDKTLCIPLGEVFALTIIISCCLLYQKYKLGLLITFIYSFYWGFLFNKGLFVDLFGNTLESLIFYLLFGFLFLAVCLYGFFVKTSD